MLLEKIHSPKDLKKLSLEQLVLLSQEVRDRIIQVVSSSGGHLASSLGAVELIIALHYCLETPRDKIVFDVGHQAYAHKILTGRNQNIFSLRQYGGISGFPSWEESEYDTFTTGHSSAAVSLALGLSCARDFLGEDYFKIVAVIGDGSLSGGLCFEGLNNAGHLKKDIVVVLNTNEMSIAPNVGALSTYLNKIISLPIYNRFRDSLEKLVKMRFPKGSRIIKIVNKFEEGLKGLFIPGMLFEELGFRYFGPLDGHNLNSLIPRMKNILGLKGPVLIHVITKKGKGYPPAENFPVRFHSAKPFDIATGKTVVSDPKGGVSYTEVFSRKMVDLAENDPRVIAVCAAMPEGTGLDKFRDRFPDRFFDVGIAEAHAVCFAAGLAKEKFKPVVAIYSTFLQRAYDQIIEEVALQDLPVVFAIDRAGIVGGDGVTHQGIFDIAFLRNIPRLIIMAPRDKAEMERMLEFAFQCGNPVAIRYPKDEAPVARFSESKISLGKAELIKKGRDFTVIALGSAVNPAIGAVSLLEENGLRPTVINARFVKPLDSALFESVIEGGAHIFTVEEGVVEGGFGSAVSEALNRPVIKIGVPSQFIPHGSRKVLLEKYGLTSEGIAEKILSTLNKNRNLYHRMKK